MFAVNVKSQLVSVQAALPELRRAGGILYVASKFAVRGCVIALAHELAPEVRGGGSVTGLAPQ
jgi:phthalate 3,4-cis-dihydrodiol dehydrogenase